MAYGLKASSCDPLNIHIQEFALGVSRIRQHCAESIQSNFIQKETKQVHNYHLNFDMGLSTQLGSYSYLQFYKA